MKKIFVVLLAALTVLSFAACGGDAEKETDTTAQTTLSEADTTETDATEADATEADATEADVTGSEPAEDETIEGDPAEYGMEYWEEKYPGENICPFYIDEDGTEYSYYWVSGLDGWDGTISSWIDQPFNWNGWHRTDDGCIVNQDETLKITDNWVIDGEGMSSFCVITTEKYEKAA